MTTFLTFVFILSTALAYPQSRSDATDINGNVYQTVIIGEQEWFAENLRVTKYQNGDPIPTGLSNNEWANTTSGAYAIYDNDDDMLEVYGKLYNWYAVDDPRGLCPEGWHVPSNDDWTQLVNYLIVQGFPNSGIANSAGNALKSCRQINSPLGGDCDTEEHPRWDSHDTHSGFDEFGFSALPAGARQSNGTFSVIGEIGHWWTSTEDSSDNAWRRMMINYGGLVYTLSVEKTIGFSIRCVRDATDEPGTAELYLEAQPETAGHCHGCWSTSRRRSCEH